MLMVLPLFGILNTPQLPSMKVSLVAREAILCTVTGLHASLHHIYSCCLVTKSRSTLCPSGSSVHRISQAGTLEWVARPSSRGSSRPKGWIHVTHGSHCRWILYCWATGKARTYGVYVIYMCTIYTHLLSSTDRHLGCSVSWLLWIMLHWESLVLSTLPI